MPEEPIRLSRFAVGLSRLERRCKRFMKQALAAKGFTGIAYTYIIAIKNNPGVNQDYLADIQGVDKSRVTRIVQNLELDGYISRELSSEDRRQYILRLSDKGEELCSLIEQSMKEWAALISSGIRPSDIEQIVDTMDIIIRNLDGIRHRNKTKSHNE